VVVVEQVQVQELPDQVVVLLMEETEALTQVAEPEVVLLQQVELVELV
jgi:hypothetical protein